MSNNIDPELQQIRNGLYGEDIRTAIHDALGKLWVLAESKEPEPGGDRVSVYDAMSGTQVTAGSTVILDPYEEHFGCDAGYYFDSEVEATLNGNLRKKSNSIPAIGIVVYSSVGYSFPVFISPVPQGTYINVSEEAVGTVTYDAITWYWTKEEGGVSGNRSDSSGNMQKYPTTCGWNDSIRSIPSSDVLAILAYVHTRKEI